MRLISGGVCLFVIYAGLMSYVFISMAREDKQLKDFIANIIRKVRL